MAAVSGFSLPLSEEIMSKVFAGSEISGFMKELI
jgi:hypothetical protein